MATYHVLYNPYAAAGNGYAQAQEAQKHLPNDKFIFYNVTIIDYSEFFRSIASDDCILICGGDGTLSRFVNDTIDFSFENDVYYYACGTGNDFIHDLNKTAKNEPIRINDYIKDLPVCYVNEKKHRFVNNVGLGIEGYACAVAESLREKSKKANYAVIAAKGLLYAYSPISATITIDETEYHFKHTWLASSMNGRFFGGGLMCAPDQNRLNKEKKITFVLANTRSRLSLIPVFLGIFSGKHVKYKKIVHVFSCHEVCVQFDKPTSLQIDGEVFLNVKEYRIEATASSTSSLKEEITS